MSVIVAIDRSVANGERTLIALRYGEFVKSSPVTTVAKRAVLVYHHETVLALPARATQRVKIIVRHIGIHVIVVSVSQIRTILFKQYHQIRVVAYQMFRYLGVRLTQVETINVHVTSHSEVLSDGVLLIASYVIEYEYRVRKCLARRDNVAILSECKITYIFQRCQQIFQVLICRLLQRFRVHVYVLETHAVRTLQQTYQYVGFTAIGGATNDATDRVR